MTLALEAPPLPLRMDADGTVRVGRTRVILDLVISAFNQGRSPEEIQYGYPTLELADVYSVIAYYLRQKDEVDEYLRQRRRAADELRNRIEAETDARGWRERLLARHAERMSNPRDPVSGR